MTSFDHRRPLAWRGAEAMSLAPELGEALERWIGRLARGEEEATGGVEQAALCLRLHHQLECGSGVLRHDSPCLAGLDGAAFRRVFDRFCADLGRPVPINLQGATTKEVRDAGAVDSPLAPARGHMTNQELAFHSDRADLTVLACWQPAAAGGEFRVASSAALMEDIEREAPEWFDWLRRPIPHDLRDEGAQADQSWCELPLLSDDATAFALRYIRKFNESTARHGVTLASPVRAMLDDIDARLQRPEASVEFAFRRGVIVIVNNHTTLHARTAFTDDPWAPRCLLRCWLSSAYTRALPPSWAPIFHDVRPGAWRGGVLRADARAAVDA